MRTVPREAAELARDLRERRRTRSGLRPRPWLEVLDELRRRGWGGFDVHDLQHAVSGLTAPAPSPAFEEGYREAWQEHFAGEAWPGLEAARRRVLERARAGR